MTVARISKGLLVSTSAAFVAAAALVLLFEYSAMAAGFVYPRMNLPAWMFDLRIAFSIGLLAGVLAQFYRTFPPSTVYSTSAFLTGAWWLYRSVSNFTFDRWLPESFYLASFIFIGGAAAHVAIRARQLTD